MSDTDTTVPRPFNQFLIEQRTGGLHNELSEKLAELVAACAEQNKAGSLTLTIRVNPTRAANQFEVSDEIKVKAPAPERGASLFFGDVTGGLSRTNPRQPELPLQEVPARPSEVKEINR